MLCSVNIIHSNMHTFMKSVLQVFQAFFHRKFLYLFQQNLRKTIGKVGVFWSKRKTGYEFGRVKIATVWVVFPLKAGTKQDECWCADEAQDGEQGGDVYRCRATI